MPDPLEDKITSDITTPIPDPAPDTDPDPSPTVTHVITVNGKKQTLSTEDLIKLAQRASSSDEKFQSASEALKLSKDVQGALVNNDMDALRRVYSRYYTPSEVDTFMDNIEAQTQSAQPQTQPPPSSTTDPLLDRIATLEARLEQSEEYNSNDLHVAVRERINTLLDTDPEISTILASLPDDDSRKRARARWEKQVLRNFQDQIILLKKRGERPSKQWAVDLPVEAVKEAKEDIFGSGAGSATHLGRASESSVPNLAREDPLKIPEPTSTDFDADFENYATDKLLRALDKANATAAREGRPTI